MGLSAPRKRVKLSHDPNNTQWTRDSSSYGQKLMTAQGWQPGQYLGAKDASHAEFHTAANASHIRVAVKDDTLGLGAKKGTGVGEGECTGLDAFQSLLGRLNGKDEEDIRKEEKSREDLKRAIYCEKKWGSVRFVRGGVLVGDKILDLIKGEKERLESVKLKKEEGIEALEESKSIKVEQSPAEVFAVKLKKSKREKEINPEVLVDEQLLDVSSKESDIELENVSKAKKKRKRQQKQEEAENVTVSSDETKDARKKSKKDKKAKKERKARNMSNDEESAQASINVKALKKSKTKSSQKIKEEDMLMSDTLLDTSLVAIPPLVAESASNLSAGTAAGTSSNLVGRHAVRSRNIAQKRLAVMDTASLNQIFMIKP